MHMSPSKRSAARRAGLAGLVGSALEWYDMFLYGTAAALVFNRIMFATDDPLVGAIAAFGTYAVGFVIRPLGGVIFGAMGDRIGRKKVLVITLLMMGGATTLIGVVPDFSVIGAWAPILLILLRAVQGLGAGAEYAGASVLVVESVGRKHRGFAGALPASGVFVGTMLSSGAFALVSLLPESSFLAWGWRIPFLASVIIVIVALVIRLRVAESPVFKDLAAAPAAKKATVGEVLRTQKRPLFVLMGAHVAQNGVGAIFQVFVVTYLTTAVGVAAATATSAVLVGAFVSIFSTMLFGALSDRFGRKKVYLASALFAAAFAFPFFFLLDSASEPLIVLAVVAGLSLGSGAMLGVQGSYFTELFDPHVRMTAFSLGRESVSAIVGGFTPMIAVTLLATQGMWAVALLTMVLALVGVVAVASGPETYRKSLMDSEASDDDARVPEGVSA